MKAFHIYISSMINVLKHLKINIYFHTSIIYEIKFLI